MSLFYAPLAFPLNCIAKLEGSGHGRAVTSVTPFDANRFLRGARLLHHKARCPPCRRGVVRRYARVRLIFRSRGGRLVFLVYSFFCCFKPLSCWGRFLLVFSKHRSLSKGDRIGRGCFGWGALQRCSPVSDLAVPRDGHGRPGPFLRRSASTHSLGTESCMILSFDSRSSIGIYKRLPSDYSHPSRIIRRIPGGLVSTGIAIVVPSVGLCKNGVPSFE